MSSEIEGAPVIVRPRDTCAEIKTCDPWPIANIGFFATQVAQLLRRQQPIVFSFEPVPHTFQLLRETVRSLQLEKKVFPICCALMDQSGMARFSFSERDTMYAQFVKDAPNLRIGNKTAWATALTLDQAVKGIDKKPQLIKIDVEGQELNVLRGGCLTLDPAKGTQAICFEFNPLTQKEAGVTGGQFIDLLSGYDFHYIDDWQGGRLAFGALVMPAELAKIDWLCNIFAVPANDAGREHWQTCFADAQGLLAAKQP